MRGDEEEEDDEDEVYDWENEVPEEGERGGERGGEGLDEHEEL